MSENKIEKNIDEPLLCLKNNRLTILPIVYPDIWKFYKDHESMIWHAHEIELEKDLSDWNRLSKDEQYFIKHILAFFASSDMVVAENLAVRFMKEIQIPEVKFFYGFQLMIENVHSESYSNMIDAYIKDPKEKNRIFNAAENIPCIQKKIKWAQIWIESSRCFAERLIAFSIVEGIFFSGAFCSIFWLKEQGKMKGLAKGNEFIARDESLHMNFACYLYKNYIKNKVSNETFKKILLDAIEIEIEFITEALPCKLLGMNSKAMIEYIKFVSNNLCKLLGYEPVYENIQNPFPFMERICLTNKTNFFESTPTEYSIDTKNIKKEEDIDFSDL